MWNERFSGSEFVFGKAPAAFLVDQAAFLEPGATALSIADGEGRNSVYLAQQGLSVTAMEHSPNAIAKARALAAERGVTVDFHEGDVFTWDWEAAHYDIVVGVFFQFMGVEARKPIFDGIKRAVVPGGLAMIHGYTPKQLDYRTGGPGVEENLYTEAFLADTFAGWEILRLASYDRELDEGAGHSGMSALIDLVARKSR